MEKVLASYNKAIESVEKQKATIVRHEKQLEKKISALTKFGVELTVSDLDNLDPFKWVNGKATNYYWEVCDVDGKLEDIKSAKKKLIEKERIVEGWKVKLEKAKEKAQNFADLPAVIIEFGERYKQSCIKWYWETLEIATKQYAEVKDGLTYRESAKYICENFGSEFFELLKLGKKGQTEFIEKVNETRKNSLLQMLIIRVKEVVGSITNAKGLEIANNGEINGLIIGSEGSATIKTILAGGYNIQCLHYRVLVHEVK